MLGILDIGASGLRAQRTRMDTIAQNVASFNVVGDTAGTRNIPYRRRFAVLSPGQPEDPSKPGVHVSDIKLDRAPFRPQFEPGNPLADAQGNVLYPNVDLSVEFVNALEASRAYEANITMMETTKGMFNAALRIIA